MRKRVLLWLGTLALLLGPACSSAGGSAESGGGTGGAAVGGTGGTSAGSGGALAGTGGIAGDGGAGASGAAGLAGSTGGFAGACASISGGATAYKIAGYRYDPVGKCVHPKEALPLTICIVTPPPPNTNGLKGALLLSPAGECFFVNQRTDGGFCGDGGWKSNMF